MKYDVFRDATLVVQNYPRPQKPAAPAPFLELLKLTLHLVEGSTFHQPHQVADRQLGRYRHKHVDMIG